MAKNAVNYTGLIPEVGDSFESATTNTTGNFEGIDTKIGIIDDNITDINNNISNVDNTSDLTKVKVNTYANLNTTDKTIVGAINEVDSDLGDHIEDIANPHAVTKTQVGLSNVDNTSDVTKMTASTFSGLNTTDKTIVGAINETIVTDSAANGNIKIAGVESKVYTHPNHSGDIVSTGDGDTVISENVVSNSKLAQMPTMTIKGNDAVGSADPQDLTIPEVRTMITDTSNRFVTDAQITQWSWATEPRATAKAWVNFNGIGTVAIMASYNVSSITDGGVGTYTVNFINALADKNYAFSVFADKDNNNDNAIITPYRLMSDKKTVSSIMFRLRGTVDTAGPSNFDSGNISLMVFGN